MEGARHLVEVVVGGQSLVGEVAGEVVEVGVPLAEAVGEKMHRGVVVGCYMPPYRSHQWTSQGEHPCLGRLGTYSLCWTVSAVEEEQQQRSMDWPRHVKGRHGEMHYDETAVARAQRSLRPVPRDPLVAMVVNCQSPRDRLVHREADLSLHDAARGRDRQWGRVARASVRDHSHYHYRNFHCGPRSHLDRGYRQSFHQVRLQLHEEQNHRQ